MILRSNVDVMEPAVRMSEAAALLDVDVDVIIERVLTRRIDMVFKENGYPLIPLSAIDLLRTQLAADAQR